MYCLAVILRNGGPPREPNDRPLCAHLLAPNRSQKKNHLTIARYAALPLWPHIAALPRDCAIHRASLSTRPLLCQGISTAPEHSSLSFSLSTVPLARRGLLERVDLLRPSPPDLSWLSPPERRAPRHRRALHWGILRVDEPSFQNKEVLRWKRI
jgi:hypothetical protein